MPAIGLLLFDMDDVLCRYHIERRLERLAALSGRTPAQVHDAIWGSGFEDAADRGAFDAAGYLQGFAERLGYPLSEAEWLEARRIAMQPDAAVLALAARVAAHLPIAMLTNNGPLLERHIDTVVPALRPLFGDRMLFSWRFGTSKPEPEVFRLAAARLGVAADRIHFVDDRPAYAEGARRAGLTAGVFRGADALRDDLVAAGLTFLL